jgi:AcrR family transcriptional regulator
VSTEIPRTLRVLWGSRGTNPAQPALTLDRIVVAAIGIADREGIAALSMSRLAQEVGSAPMSLYRHVANKDELLVFMQDAAPGPPPELPSGWRQGLAAWGTALRDVYLAHPWILQVIAGRPPLEPGQLAWLDRALSALDGIGLPIRDKYDVVATVLNFVRGDAHLIAVLLNGKADPMPEYGAVVAGLVTADRFPALAPAIAEGLFELDPADTNGTRTFRFGLERVLDGCQQIIDKA